MRRADRLLQIIQILRRERRPVSGGGIAAELEVSLRTIYRDIVALQSTGVPVIGEGGVGYILEDGYDLPPLMFTEKELEIVMLGLRMASARGDAEITRTARDAVAKIASVLPDDRRIEFLDAPLLAPGTEDLSEDGVVALAALRNALRTERKVELIYRIPDKQPETRIVWPISIAFFERARVLAAWCELRQAYRYFRTDRILKMTVLDTPLPRSRRHLYSEWWRHEEISSQVKAV